MPANPYVISKNLSPDIKTRLNSVFGVHSPGITTGAAQQRNPMWPHAEELHRQALEDDQWMQPDIEDEDHVFVLQIRANREATALMQASYNFDQYDEAAHIAWGERMVAYFNTVYNPVLPEDSEAWANIAWQIHVLPNLIECMSVEPSRIGRHQFWIQGFSRADNFGDSDDEHQDPPRPRVLWITVGYEGPFELESPHW